MKILHVLNISFAIPHMLGNQISFFQENGDEIHIACSADNNFFKYQKKWNFKFVEISVKRKFSLFHDIKLILKLVLYIKKNNIDIIVGHTPKGALLGMISGFLCRKKKRFYFRHGLVYETSKGLRKLLLLIVEQIISLFSSHIYCVSKSIRNKSVKVMFFEKRKIIYFNRGSCNGVDLDSRFNPKKISLIDSKSLLNKYNLNSKNFIVGYVGRLAKDKGIEQLVNSWSKVKNDINGAKLILCGPIDSRDPISKSVIDKIKSDKDIIFTGEVDNIEIYYTIFTIFILPSFREGLPTAVLEASSMKLPIITSRSTGCIDSIIEGKTGIFCDITENDIYDKILFYYKNPKTISVHGENGRNFISKHYKKDLVWNNLFKMYHNNQ